MSNTHQQVLIYEADNGEIAVTITDDTVWLILKQLANLFDRDKSVISRHLNNIFKNKELERYSVVAKNATIAQDGKTYPMDYRNLDAVVSLGQANGAVAS